MKGKVLSVLAACFLLSGCATLQSKDFWMWTGSVVVIGAVAAHQMDNGTQGQVNGCRVVTDANGNLLCVFPATVP